MTSPSIHVEHSALGLLSVGSSRSGYVAAKRMIDVVVSFCLLVLVAVPLLIVAVLIKMDSPGPVLFKQDRVGGRRRLSSVATARGAATFRIYKFRSMVQDADPAVHERHIVDYVRGEPSAEETAGAARFKLAHDPRVTRLGRVLRRTSIDELPQLLNVLLGHMSLVGPRPVPVYEAALYSGKHLRRFEVPAGMTGMWQVKGRGNVEFEEMIRMDLAYVERRSLRLDMWLLLATVPVLVRRGGAA